MNLQSLKNKLKPKLHEIEIEGEKLYIHRPTAKDVEKCTSSIDTLFYCVKDENGDPIFSNKDENGRINVNEIDSTYINEIFTKVFSLFSTTEVQDEIEKK